MTVEELIARLQALPGDLSILPVQIQQSSPSQGRKQTHEFQILDVRRETLAVYIVKSVNEL